MKTKKRFFLPLLTVIAALCLSLGMGGIVPVKSAQATTVNKDTFAGYFTAIGDNGLDAYVNDISYGTFTNTNFSGAGVMVETRNKTAELVSHEENNNTTNPMLINFPNVKYSAGAKFNGVVDISDNTASTTLIELAFPGTNDNWQNRGFKVTIEDALNPNNYIALFVWSAYDNTDATGGSVIAAAAGTWEETTKDGMVEVGETGFDTNNYNGNAIFSIVGSDISDGAVGGSGKPNDGCFLNSAEYGHTKTSVNFSRTSANSIKVQFDNANGSLSINGVHIRDFKNFSADDTHYFPGFTGNKVKLSVSIMRTTRRSTDEFTRFCVMNIDGNDFTADGSDNVSYSGLDLTTPSFSTVNKNVLVSNFVAAGDDGLDAYVNGISYGTFTNTNFSGAGVMVETRNKTAELVDNTETSNDTNPPLINFPSVKYSAGVKFNGVVDISDNATGTTLIELAFPGTNDNWQNRGFKVIIEDASDPNNYIALFVWGSYSNWDATGGSVIAAAAGTWEETTKDGMVKVGEAGFDTNNYNGNAIFSIVGSDLHDGAEGGEGKPNDGCFPNSAEYGHTKTSINFSRTSANSIKVQFDNASGTLSINGVHIRDFRNFSADGEHYFPGFTDNKVKLSVGIMRTTKKSTDEFTRFCVMNIDGNDFTADGSDNVSYYGIEGLLNMTITDATTGAVRNVEYGNTYNVGNLFTDGAKQAVGYMVGNELHDIAELSALTVSSSETYNIVYAHFWMTDGAYVRVASPTGIRFKGWLKGNNHNVDETVNIVSEFGMLIAPTDYIENKEFTVEDAAPGKLKVVQATYSLKDGDNDTYFFVTVTDIQAKNLARSFSARPYVKVEYYDGTEAYFYGAYSEVNNSRSAYDLAKTAYNNGGTSAEEKTFLQANYIDKVIEINELGEKACDSASYTISSVSFSGGGDIIYLTVSGANGARCLVYDGATYHAGSGTVPEQTNLAMYEDGGNLLVAFKLPTKGVSVLSQGKNVISGGNTAYSILVPKNATTLENYAAEELQRILKDSYDVTLPITSEYEGANSNVISLGNTQFKKDANITLDAYAAKQGGFRIKSFNNGVAIYAEDDYALYYGMYRFLEENFGYKYYAYDCQVINSGSTQPLKAFDYEDYPDIRYRSLHSETTKNAYHIGDVDENTIPTELNAAYINMHLYTTGSRYNLYNSVTGPVYKTGMYGDSVPPFAAQLDDQSLLTYFLPYDNSWDYYATGHTYGTSHPDWYVLDGGTPKQICFSKAYSNSEMYNTIFNKLKAVITVNPNKTVFELGIGDNWGYCNCSSCSSYGNGKSDVYLRFVNKIANDVKKWQAENCPRREIYIMAYSYMSYTLAPTVETAADNVIIRICPYTAYYNKAYNDSSNYNAESNLGSANWQSIFNSWKVKAKHLGVWDYRSDFTDYLEPFPFWKQLENNVEYFKSLGVMEVFAQGMGGWSHNVLFPFEELDNYVRSRMLWDTSLSYTTLRNEFIDAYYGAAATYVKNYISAIDTAFGSTSFRVGKADITRSKYSSSWVSTVKGYFDSAYAAVSGNAEITKRLDYLSLFYRYLQVKFSYSGADKTLFKSMCATLGIVYAEKNVVIADL